MPILLNHYFSLSIDAKDYECSSGARYFGDEGDLDNDGYTNLEEWNGVIRVSNQVNEFVIDAFVDLATDADGAATGRFINQEVPYDIKPGDPGYDEILEEVSGVKHTSRPLSELTLHPGDGVTFMDYDAYLVDMQKGTRVLLPMNQPLYVTKGTKVYLKLKGTEEELLWFYFWKAENTFINGSNNRAVQFNVTNDQQSIHAVRNMPIKLMMPKQIRIKPVGHYADLVDVTAENNAKIVLGPRGSVVELIAPPELPAATKGVTLKLAGWRLKNEEGDNTQVPPKHFLYTLGCGFQFNPEYLESAKPEPARKEFPVGPEGYSLYNQAKVDWLDKQEKVKLLPKPTAIHQAAIGYGGQAYISTLPFFKNKRDGFGLSPRFLTTFWAEEGDSEFSVNVITSAVPYIGYQVGNLRRN